MASEFADYVSTPILNLSLTKATPEQIALGVIDLSAKERAMLKRLMAFTELPSQLEVESRAAAIAYFADQLYPDEHIESVMIDGFPSFLTATVEWNLRQRCKQPVYPFFNKKGKCVGFVTGA